MFFFRKKYKFVFFMIPLILLYRFDLILYAEPMEDRVGELFLMHFFGGSYNMDQIDLEVSVLGLTGIVFMDLLFADYIVQDVLNNAEYIFTRYSSRARWYRKKIIGLICYSCIGMILYMALYVGNAILTSECNITQKDVQIIGCTFIMLTLFTCFSILLINLLGLHYGNTIGFLITYSILIFSAIITRHLQENPENKIIQMVHRLNPMSNVLVSWNFSSACVLWGLGYFLFASIVILWILWKKLKWLEIGIRRRTEVS